MNKVKLIIKSIIDHSFALMLLSWYGCIRWFMLPYTNAESILWGQNQFGAFMAILSVIYLSYYIVKDIPKGIYSHIWLNITIALGIFNTWCLYGMTGIFIADMSFINVGYIVLDTSILTFYILMLIKVLHSIENTNCDCNTRIKVLGL